MRLNFSLHKMQFFAYHGVFEEEAKQGNQFLVSVSWEVDFPTNEISDRLEDTIDCVEVHREVEKEMQIRSALIEHVSWRIAQRLLNIFPKMESVRVEVSKCNPPFPSKVERSTATVRLVRNE